MSQSHELAERWLLDAAIEILPLFPAADRPALDGLAIHVGAVPGTRGTSRKTLGTYVPAELTEDGQPAIFISPLDANSPSVLATLTHELIHHASMTIHRQPGHTGHFRRIAQTIGLTGPMTATTATDELADELAGLIVVLGEYPIGPLVPDKIRKKQTTRMAKLTCPTCGAIVRASRSTPIPRCDGWTEDAGTRHAPVRMERESQDEEDAED